ncbi:TPA: hypothetical protein O8U20_003929 [Enterobacter cloacae]|nr:hypothetical protein [Enterobacter cloacae]
MLQGQALEFCRWLVLFVYITSIIFYLWRLYKTDAFSMNALPLTEQPLFKASILIPFFSFFAFGFISWADHFPQLDAEGLNNFINISKLPLALLSLSVPFGVVVNNVHRTIQTNAQINEAQIKNKNDLYYSHQKNTIEHIEKIHEENLPIEKNLNKDGTTGGTEDYPFKIRRPLNLYRKIFTKISKDNFCLDIDQAFVYTLNKHVYRIKSYFHKVRDLDNTDTKKFEVRTAFYYSKIEFELRNIALYLGIDPIYRRFCSKREYDNFILYSDLAESAELYCLVYFYFDILNDLCTIINIKLKTDTSFIYDLDRGKTNFDSIFKSPSFSYVDGAWPRGMNAKK